MNSNFVVLLVALCAFLLVLLHPSEAQCIKEQQCTPTEYNLVPLYQYFNSKIIDHFYTIKREDFPDYKYVGVAAYCSPTKIPFTVPLLRYWNSALGDNLYTIDSIEGEKNAGYSYVEVACYVFEAPVFGSTPFYRYSKKGGLETDSYYTTTIDWNLSSSGYEIVPQIHAYAGHVSTSPKIGLQDCKEVTNCGSGATATVTLSADNSFHLWKNKEQKMSGNNYAQAYQTTFKVSPGDVIVAHIFNHGWGREAIPNYTVDKGNPGALYGMIKYLDKTIYTGTNWRCTSGWVFADNFDSWAPASDYGVYTSSPWNSGVAIKDPNAHFIYSSSAQFIPGGKATCAIKISSFCDSPKVWSGSECTCPVPCSDIYSTQDSKTCNCICNSGTSAVKNVVGETKCRPPCPVNQVWNKDWSSCVCSTPCGINQVHDSACKCTCGSGFVLQTNSIGQTQCSTTCPSGRQWNSDWTQCACTNTCPASLPSHDSNCKCTCPDDKPMQTNTSGQKRCQIPCSSSMMRWNSDWSKCECSNTCSSNEIQDSATCNCLCKSGPTQTNTDGNTKCVPACPSGKVYNSNWQCVCANKCEAGIPQKGDCSCGCPPNTYPVSNVLGERNCKSRCKISGQVYTADWTSCICPNTCAPDQQRSSVSCGCICPSRTSNMTNTAGESKCAPACSKNEVYDQNWKCICQPGTILSRNSLGQTRCMPACPDPINQVYDALWKTCSCKTGTSLQTNIDGNQRCALACPSGLLYDSSWSKCVCPVGTTTEVKNVNGNIATTCLKPCPLNQVYDAAWAQCICPTGTVLLTNEVGQSQCAQPCPYNQIYNHDWTQCVCTTGESLQTNTANEQKCVQPCHNPAQIWNNDWSSCTCGNTCSSGMIHSSNCQCECPAGTRLLTNSDNEQLCTSLSDCPDSLVYDKHWSTCVCPSGTTLQRNIVGDERCYSTCPYGQIPNQEWTGCVCPPGETLQKDTNNEWKCVPVCSISCTINGMIVTSSCSCECPQGERVLTNYDGVQNCTALPDCPISSQVYSPDWTHCICPRGTRLATTTDGQPYCKTIQYQQCVVPKYFDPNLERCVCPRWCGPNEIIDQTSCQCKPGFAVREYKEEKPVELIHNTDPPVDSQVDQVAVAPVEPEVVPVHVLPPVQNEAPQPVASVAEQVPVQETVVSTPAQQPAEPQISHLEQAPIPDQASPQLETKPEQPAYTSVITEQPVEFPEKPSESHIEPLPVENQVPVVSYAVPVSIEPTIEKESQVVPVESPKQEQPVQEPVVVVPHISEQHVEPATAIPHISEQPIEEPVVVIPLISEQLVQEPPVVVPHISEHPAPATPDIPVVEQEQPTPAQHNPIPVASVQQENPVQEQQPLISEPEKLVHPIPFVENSVETPVQQPIEPIAPIVQEMPQLSVHVPQNLEIPPEIEHQTPQEQAHVSDEPQQPVFVPVEPIVNVPEPIITVHQPPVSEVPIEPSPVHLPVVDQQEEVPSTLQPVVNSPPISQELPVHHSQAPVVDLLPEESVISPTSVHIEQPVVAPVVEPVIEKPTEPAPHASVQAPIAETPLVPAEQEQNAPVQHIPVVDHSVEKQNQPMESVQQPIEPVVPIIPEAPQLSVHVPQNLEIPPMEPATTNNPGVHIPEHVELPQPPVTQESHTTDIPIDYPLTVPQIPPSKDIPTPQQTTLPEKPIEAHIEPQPISHNEPQVVPVESPKQEQPVQEPVVVVPYISEQHVEEPATATPHISEQHIEEPVIVIPLISEQLVQEPPVVVPHISEHLAPATPDIPVVEQEQPTPVQHNPIPVASVQHDHPVQEKQPQIAPENPITSETKEPSPISPEKTPEQPIAQQTVITPVPQIPVPHQPQVPSPVEASLPVKPAEPVVLTPEKPVENNEVPPQPQIPIPVPETPHKEVPLVETQPQTPQLEPDTPAEPQPVTQPEPTIHHPPSQEPIVPLPAPSPVVQAAVQPEKPLQIPEDHVPVPEVPHPEPEKPQEPEKPVETPVKQPQEPEKPVDTPAQKPVEQPPAEQSSITGVGVEDKFGNNQNNLKEAKPTTKRSKKFLRPLLIAIGVAVGVLVLAAILVALLIAAILYSLVGKKEFYSVYEGRKAIEQLHLPLLEDLDD